MAVLRKPLLLRPLDNFMCFSQPVSPARTGWFYPVSPAGITGCLRKNLKGSFFYLHALCNFVFEDIRYGLHLHLKIIRLFLDCGWKLFLDSWFTWLFFCVFVNVLWKGLLLIMHNHTDCIYFFGLCPLCDSKCLLKSSAWTDAKSHWLHLTGFSPLCVFKCLLKALV